MILYDTPNRDVFNVMKDELDKVSYFIRKNGKKISQYFPIQEAATFSF